MAFGIGRLLGHTLTGTGGLESVERVLASVGRGSVVVLADRCTRARHRRSTCAGCGDACSFGAIRLPDAEQAAPARVDPEKCNGCGLCIPACPTQAITSDRRPLPQPGGKQQSVACGSAAALGADAEAWVPCLGALDPAFWLEGVGRSLTVYRGLCASCPIPGGEAAFERNLAAARAVAALENADIRIRVQDVKADAPRKPAEPGGARLSRRDFFRLAGREARQDVLAAVLPESSGQAWRGGRLRREPSPRRQAIAEHLPAESSGPFARDLPLWQLTLDPTRCTACGLCAEACPEAALRWSAGSTEGDGETGDAALVFDPVFCDGCRLCVDVCPERASVLVRAVPPWRRGPQALLKGRRGNCARCGATFLSDHGEATCRRCTSMAEGTFAALLRRGQPGDPGD